MTQPPHIFTNSNFLLFCGLLVFFQWNTTSAQPLFNLISPSQSGVTFNNTITDTRDANILLYSNYYGGAGVGIADFDQDGLQDIYFAGNLVGDQLYKNKGDLSFLNVTKEAGIEDNGEWSSSVVIGDINNDGLSDIYVTAELYDDAPQKRRNRLYINKGNMKFVESAADYGLASTERTRGATFIDYNQDGWLDLFLLNQPPNPGNYSEYHGTNLLQNKWSPRLYENKKNGTFQDVTIKSGLLKACYPNAAVAADINNDGWQDLYVSNDYEAPDFMYINNRDGTFINMADSSLRHMSYYAMGVDVADINNDGLLDIMTLDMVAEDNYRQKANMGGMYPEAFWKLVKAGGHYQYMFNALQLNQGNNYFSDVAQLAGVSNTDWSWSNIIADFDNDGWKDVYITNGLLRDIRNTDASSAFPEYVKEVAQKFINENPNAGDVSILDILNLKEGLDLMPSIPISNYVYRNTGNLKMTNQTSAWGLQSPSFSNGCAYGDLDNDGDLEIIVSNINQEAFIYENLSNTSDEHNYLQIELIDPADQTVQGSKIYVSQNQIKQTIELTSSRGMYSSSQSIGHFGFSTDSAVEIEIQWPDGTLQKLENVNINQKLQITKGKSIVNNKVEVSNNLLAEKVEFSDLISTTHQENDFDDYSIQVLLPHEMSHQGPAMEVGDLNGDGLDDILLGGARDQRTTLFLQDKNGKFLSTYLGEASDAKYEDVDAAFLDINLDGLQDIYVVSGGNSFAPNNRNYLDRVYLNSGNKSWKRCDNCIPRILESGSVVKPYDFDKDGDLDLFIGGRHQPWDYPSPSISRLLRNDNGKMVDITKTSARDLIFLGMVTDATWSDVNNDKMEDLIIVGEWMPITILLQTEEGFEKLEESRFKLNDEEFKSNGWWSTIQEVENHDGSNKKFIIGNLGENYKYKASQVEPFKVYYEDFDANGRKDIILSYYNDGLEFPLRGRSCSAQQIPGLKEDFPTYDLFASSDITSVYGSSSLENSLSLESYEFASCMISISPDPNQAIDVELLPTEAQISTINSIVEYDFDSDGQDEYFVSGNMFQSEIETPRNDGGLSLILDTNTQGAINTIGPTQSGIYSPYDSRSSHIIKIGDEHYLIMAVNDGPLQTWKLKSHNMKPGP